MTKIQKFSIFTLAVGAIYLLFSISTYYLADVNYSYGLKYSKINDQQKAAGYFEKALKLRQEPVYMDKFSASLAYIAALASMQNQVNVAKQIANVADSYNQKIIRDFPENVFAWKTRAKNMYYFYQITNKETELLQGVDALKRAQKLSPTDPKIPYSLALYYSTLYDGTKDETEKQNWKELSLKEIDAAIKLKSNYQEAHSFRKELIHKFLGSNV